MSALLLSRLQFAWVIALHIILPAFTVGLSCFIATLEVRGWLTDDPVIKRLSAFWIKVFAVSFGMGVVSGIVMPFQFGTNWSRFTDSVSPVIGALLAYEALTAFFLESAFLGVLLFGRRLVPPWAHAGSAVLVAFGTVLSSFWILAVNSWMQTPRGYTMSDGRFMPIDMLAVLFTPSFPFRLAHTVTAFVVTCALVILAVGAYYLRHNRFVPESRVMMRMSVAFLAIMVPIQMVLGDAHGLNTLEYQPAKLAAMEGLWDGGSGVPASLIGIPDQKGETNRFEIAIPKLGSLYLTHDLHGTVKGLKDFAPEDRPPVLPVYFAFRIMVGAGLLMLFVALCGLVLWYRKRLFTTNWYLKLCMLTGPLGFIAVLAGWTTTEVGRQPWVVYGLMRTRDAVTPSLATGDVVASLSLYFLTYLVIFGGGAVLIARLIKVGPDIGDEPPPAAEQQRPSRPISAVASAAPKLDNHAST